jgi:hypothetical protein
LFYGADRRAIFGETVREIIRHNADSTNNYKKGINAYSDMTDNEFMSYFNIKSIGE